MYCSSQIKAITNKDFIQLVNMKYFKQEGRFFSMFLLSLIRYLKLKMII